MNFGETLAYWYLRLNGFIPMRNFVLHRAGIQAPQSADTDLLAIRFPGVLGVERLVILARIESVCRTLSKRSRIAD